MNAKELYVRKLIQEEVKNTLVNEMNINHDRLKKISDKIRFINDGASGHALNEIREVFNLMLEEIKEIKNELLVKSDKKMPSTPYLRKGGIYPPNNKK